MDGLRTPRIRASHAGIYYGYGPFSALAAFDLLILEPKGWKPADMEALKRRGCRLLAYVSLLEARPEVVRSAGLESRDFVKVGGKPWRREEFETVVVEPRSERWREYILDEVARLVAAGWDGVFIDGLGDVEDELVSGESSRLVPQAADLVREVRRTLGPKLLMQNNGLWLLLPLVAPYLDGICWEGPVEQVDFVEPWATVTMEMLARYGGQYGLVTMLVSTIGTERPEGVDTLTTIGRRFGCLTYAAPCDYARGIRLPNGEVVMGS